MQEVGADDLKEQKTEKATPLKKNAHWEIQCFLILPFAVSPPIIFISLRQSALSGEGPARRSAASKRPFFPTVTARAQGFLSQTHPPTSRNASAGVTPSPKIFPFTIHCATTVSEFPEPQNSKYHSQCQESNLKGGSRDGPSASARFLLNNNNNYYNYNNNNKKKSWSVITGKERPFPG